MEFNQQQIDPAILAEQKAYKASKESFREAIKTLAEQQRDLKPQRKQNSPDGGVITPAMATSTHRLNRWELRHLHIAYAVFRGKSIPEQYWGWDTTKKSIFCLQSTDKKGLLHPHFSPDYKLVEKLLSKHVHKAKVEYPTKDETLRDSPGGYGGC